MPTTTQRTAAELRELVRDGADDITADDIAAAVQREEHEALVAEARSRAEIRDIEQARAAALTELRTDITAVRDDDRAHLTELANAAAGALSALVIAIAARNDTIIDLVRRARALDIAGLDGTATPVDPSGIGWAAGPGRSSVIAIDDRTISGAEALDVLERLVREVAAQHRLRNRTWRSAEVAPPVSDQLARLDVTVQPPEQTTVHLVRRWGQHPAGSTVSADLATAAWLRRTGLADQVA